MAEIIKEPHTHVVHQTKSTDNSGSMAALIGVALLVLLALIFLFYALPIINRATTIPTINVPDKVNVNVNKTQ